MAVDGLVLSTGYGLWSPLAWIVTFVIALIACYLLWRLGVSSYKPGTEQSAPYLSGNKADDPTALHVPGGNLYWGFIEGLKWYYDRIIPLHTGIVTDYLIWMFGVAAILLVLVMVVI
ncbi:MAG: hydrogenase [Methanomicrobiales archaeon]|jgi:hypothetical protein|nr:hydrogenase [Methanomicrobiales archaeon]